MKDGNLGCQKGEYDKEKGDQAQQDDFELWIFAGNIPFVELSGFIDIYDCSRNKENLAGMRIRKKAMLHAITSNPDLKGKIFHKVRYAEPEVHTSMFILDQPKKQQNSDSWMDFLKMNHIQEPLQISAVWDDPATKKKIVIVGISSDEKLENWMPLKAVELTEKEAKIYLGSKYTVYSDDSEDPFSPEFGKKKKTNDMSEPE